MLKSELLNILKTVKGEISAGLETNNDFMHLTVSKKDLIKQIERKWKNDDDETYFELRTNGYSYAIHRDFNLTNIFVTKN